MTLGATTHPPLSPRPLLRLLSSARDTHGRVPRPSLRSPCPPSPQHRGLSLCGSRVTCKHVKDRNYASTFPVFSLAMSTAHRKHRAKAGAGPGGGNEGRKVPNKPTASADEYMVTELAASVPTRANANPTATCGLVFSNAIHSLQSARYTDGEDGRGAPTEGRLSHSGSHRLRRECY